ncbi:unnamed protein product [Schistocephalus solidus]|uniref:DDE Tnp4 domain-containing protein n=1 Tax=Schistocephalus solidus TaxID=70667 RepID=A0A183SRJ0_SCHSO|nr:unnamed protein product [Schistocephalus solidus]
MANYCSHGTLLDFGCQGSHLNICYVQQDLHPWRLHVNSYPSFHAHNGDPPTCLRILAWILTSQVSDQLLFTQLATCCSHHQTQPAIQFAVMARYRFNAPMPFIFTADQLGKCTLWLSFDDAPAPTQTAKRSTPFKRPHLGTGRRCDHCSCAWCCTRKARSPLGRLQATAKSQQTDRHLDGQCSITRVHANAYATHSLNSPAMVEAQPKTTEEPPTEPRPLTTTHFGLHSQAIRIEGRPVELPHKFELLLARAFHPLWSKSSEPYSLLDFEWSGNHTSQPKHHIAQQLTYHRLPCWAIPSSLTVTSEISNIQRHADELTNPTVAEHHLSIAYPAGISPQTWLKGDTTYPPTRA